MFCSSRILIITILFFFLIINSMTSIRKKRFIGFPKGSSFQVTVAMSTFLPKDTLPRLIPIGLAHIVEYDFAYPLPNKIEKHPSRKKVKNTKSQLSEPGWYDFDLLQSQPKKRKNERRGRLVDNVKDVMDRSGLNGAACMERLSCEAFQHLRLGQSLLEDIVLTILSERQSRNVCSIKAFKDCPISLLQILLHSERIDEFSLI